MYFYTSRYQTKVKLLWIIKKMTKNLQIPKPSKKEIKYYLKLWDSPQNYNYSLQESSLKKLFTKTHPFNNDLDDVLVKVCTLNQLYSIQIRKIFGLAKHIVSLNIDVDLKNNNPDLVGRIASGHKIHISKKAKESYLYSFATKYCSHHKPTIYPIYDSYVGKMLIHYKESDFNFR